MPISLKSLLILALPIPALGQAPTDYTEKYRPQYHFTPAKNWTNDPNGLVYDQGEYHLFYQYNPFGDRWGHMSWGHAVSPDLVHWQELPVAILEENGMGIFSGSAVVDPKNTSGFGAGGKPPLVAIYAGDLNRMQTQNIAYSNDRGRTWIKYPGNPVINIDERDFRDPKVFWHEPTHRWVMIVALSADRKVLFYGSSNLKEWKHLGEFGPEGSTGGVWECPDFFELPIAGEPGRSKWVLKVDVNEHAVAGGSGGQYFIGDFDGTTFHNDNPADRTLWIEHGKDFYASQSWSDVPPKDGRRIWLAWMSNWQYANDVPTSPWRNGQSLPRVLSLKRLPDGVRLIQTPVEELKQLRGEHRHVDDLTIIADRPWSDERFAGTTLEIVAEFDPGSAKEIGLKVRKGEREETIIGYSVDSQSLFVDRTHSGESGFSRDFVGKHAAPLRMEGGKVRLHLFVDASSVEVFGGDGRAVITDLIFPDPKSLGLEVYAQGGQAQLTSLDLWPLRSAWKQP